MFPILDIIYWPAAMKDEDLTAFHPHHCHSTHFRALLPTPLQNWLYWHSVRSLLSVYYHYVCIPTHTYSSLLSCALCFDHFSFFILKKNSMQNSLYKNLLSFTILFSSEEISITFKRVSSLIVFSWRLFSWSQPGCYLGPAVLQSSWNLPLSLSCGIPSSLLCWITCFLNPMPFSFPKYL